MHQHADHSEDHPHRQLEGIEEPLDAANQSLSDALRASFRILKGIMMVLVLLYIFSNVRRVESHEQALLLRLGHLSPIVYDAGVVWAFPFPIDEIVPLPTRQSNDLPIDSHTFSRRPDEIGKPLTFIGRGMEGLNPALDGALLTADAGLVHTKWKVTYKFDDVRSYVSQIVGKDVEAATRLIRCLVETVGIHVAGEHTAEEMIRTRVDDVQNEMRKRVNDRLEELHSGIEVTRIEMFEPTPPIPIREAFDGTQRAENAKQKRIQDAQQQRTKMLSEAAGAAFPRVIQLLNQVDKGGRDASAEAGRKKLDLLLTTEVEGNAGRLIKDAGAYRSVVVGRMQSDVDLYRTLLPEYERNAPLLIGRLWEQTRQDIFAAAGVIKFYRPPGCQIRLHVPFDPEQARLEEERRLTKKEFDPSTLRPERLVPVGPEGG
ncbi:MAG: SPFH domain-containing protein [Planctomycetota bacterium]